MIKKNLSALFLTLASIAFALIICEIILRVKHNIIPNYDIEMWRYAKELKLKVEFDNINHIHVKNKSSVLQKVEIKTNSYGQRDINYDNNYLNKFDKSFLIIGSSIPLGWGVEKEKTFAHLLNIESKKKGKKWIFINGGVGNYNASRYVNNYLKYWNPDSQETAPGPGGSSYNTKQWEGVQIEMEGDSKDGSQCVSQGQAGYTANCPWNQLYANQGFLYDGAPGSSTLGSSTNGNPDSFGNWTVDVEDFDEILLELLIIPPK